MNIREIAFNLAKQYHSNQKYADLSYINHLIDVENVLINQFFDNEIYRSAALLHDILEDTAATPTILSAAGIPDNVIKIVVLVTYQPGANRAERNAKTLPLIRGSRRASIVKLADRIANVQFSIDSQNYQKFYMYRNENKEFKNLLYNEDYDLDIIWDEIDYLINDEM